MSYECMYDCIHLHACRRIQYIARKCRIITPRFCDENCNCYVSGDLDDYVTVSEAIQYARDGAEAIANGHPADRIYAIEDLESMTLGEIVEDAEASNEY